MEGYKEYEKMSEPPQHTRNELMGIRSRILNGMDKEGITYDGVWTNEKKDKNGRPIHNKEGKQEFKKRHEIIGETKKTQDQYRRTFSGSKEGRNLSDQMDKTIAYDRIYNDTLGVQKAGDAVVPFVSDIKSMILGNPSLYSAKEANTIKEIDSRINKGERLVTASDAEFLRKYMDKTTADQFKTAVTKYDDAIQTALEANPNLTIQDLLTSGALSGTIANAKVAAENSAKAEQTILDKMSDADKIAYQEYKTVTEKQSAALATTNAFNTAAPKDLFYVTGENGTKLDQRWSDTKSEVWLKNTDIGTEIKEAGSATTAPVQESTPQSTSYQSAPAQGSSGLFESSGSNAYGSNQGSSVDYWGNVGRAKPTPSGPMPWESTESPASTSEPDYTPIENNISEYEARVAELKSKQTLTTEEQVELMMKQNMIDANKKRKNGKPNE